MNAGLQREKSYLDTWARVALVWDLKMYGRKASELVKEIASSEKGQLTPFSVKIEWKIASFISFVWVSLILFETKYFYLIYFIL